MSTPTKHAGHVAIRVARAALAAAGAIATPIAVAHGEHGPGGHDGWSLEHFEPALWGATDWAIAALLVAAALGGWRALRRNAASRRSNNE
jgi:hypothetical protein